MSEVETLRHQLGLIAGFGLLGFALLAFASGMMIGALARRVRLLEARTVHLDVRRQLSPGWTLEDEDDFPEERYPPVDPYREL